MVLTNNKGRIADPLNLAEPCKQIMSWIVDPKNQTYTHHMPILQLKLPLLEHIQTFKDHMVAFGMLKYLQKGYYLRVG